MTFENFIPPRAKSVLELTGEVANDFETSEKKFLEIQPECNYTVSKNLLSFDEKFDSILIQSAAIGNLENSELVNLIETAAAFLNKRGILIFTLDNIGYAENVMAILEGKPLKFKSTLSKVELEDAIKTAGLNEYNTLNAGRRVPVARGVVEAAKIDVSVFKYIIFATPEELPKRTSIQVAVGEKLVCGPSRVFNPNAFISTEPNIATFTYDSGQKYKLFRPEEFGNRIFINQRISFPTFTEGKNFFEKLRDSGYLYIEEIDDNPIIWRKDYERSGFINFVGVHAVQTTTEYLAARLRTFNPNVKVFANQLKKISPLRNFKEQKNKPVQIFFGAVNRDAEFKAVLPILNKLAQDYGNKITFKIIANKELFDMLETENKIFAGNPDFFNGQFIPHEKYLEILRESDIALLPLLDNEFNRSKSDLKFIECASCGAAVLASPVVYSKTVKDDETGLIYNDDKEFSQKLKLLIDNKEKRYELATAAYDYVLHNRLLSQHYEERLDWYFELLAKLDELNKATQARTDKIAPKFKDEKPPVIQNTNAPIEGNLGPNAEIIIPNEW